jgi:hypothetical protein
LEREYQVPVTALIAGESVAWSRPLARKLPNSDTPTGINPGNKLSATEANSGQLEAALGS